MALFGELFINFWIKEIDLLIVASVLCIPLIIDLMNGLGGEDFLNWK